MDIVGHTRQFDFEHIDVVVSGFGNSYMAVARLMKTWQKIWIYSSFSFFAFHLVRDILQDAGIHMSISDTLTKKICSQTAHLYWSVINTYVIEISVMVLNAVSIKRGIFGLTGYVSMGCAILFWAAWLYYWFFM